MADRWKQFWFEPRSTESLSLIRVFFGFALFMKLTDFAGLSRIGSLHMDFPHHAFGSAATYTLAGFRMPMPGFGWLPVPTLGQFKALETFQLILCVAFVAGVFVRWVTPVLTLSLVYPMLVSQFLFRHHAFLFVLVMAILSIAGCGDHFGLGAYVRRERGDRPLRPVLPLRLLQVLVGFVYLYSALGKTNGGWGGGLVLRSLDSVGQLEGPLKPLILAVIPIGLLSIATVLTEWSLAIGLWIRPLRRHVIAAGILLHLGIDAMMYVHTFGYQMIALYIAFIQPEAFTTEAFYDGSSARCRTWARGTALLDWFKRVGWYDGSSEEQAFTVRTSLGDVYSGFEAWRRLFGVFPLTFLPSYLLRVPGISTLGARVYERAAARRQAVS